MWMLTAGHPGRIGEGGEWVGDMLCMCGGWVVGLPSGYLYIKHGNKRHESENIV